MLDTRYWILGRGSWIHYSMRRSPCTFWLDGTEFAKLIRPRVQGIFSRDCQPNHRGNQAAQSEEQLGVIRFAYQLDAERHLTGTDIVKPAERMVQAGDAMEAATIREAIVRGFYGRSNA